MSRIAEAFDGKTFDDKRDGSRLNAQLDDVRAVMFAGGWRTLDEISKATGHPTASVSARLRDLRKTKFGGYRVSKRIRKGQKGLWEYRLDFPDPAKQERDAKRTALALSFLAAFIVSAIYVFMLLPAFASGGA